MISPSLKLRKSSLIMSFQTSNHSVPPFILYVNPQDRTWNFTKLVSSHYTRRKWKIEFYGDELERHDFTGKTGAFYTEETGLTRFGRRDSENYQNFMKLLEMYKSNAVIPMYNNSTDFKPKTWIEDVGYVILNYDDCSFQGRFEQFSVTENAEYPFLLDYNFSMIVYSKFRSIVKHLGFGSGGETKKANRLYTGFTE